MAAVMPADLLRLETDGVLIGADPIAALSDADREALEELEDDVILLLGGRW